MQTPLYPRDRCDTLRAPSYWFLKPRYRITRTAHIRTHVRAFVLYTNATLGPILDQGP